MLSLLIYFFQVPDEAQQAALGRWFGEISKIEHLSQNHRRLWISRLPGTTYRPFSKREPFDVQEGRPDLLKCEIEAFRVSTAASPRWMMRCATIGQSREHAMILLDLVEEILQRWGGMLAFSEGEVEGILKLFDKVSDFDPCMLATFCGNVYELACEREDGELHIFQLVDSRCFKAWRKSLIQEPQKTSSDLPYSRRAASLDY